MIINCKHNVNLIKKPVIYQISKRYMLASMKKGANMGAKIIARALSTRAGNFDPSSQLVKTPVTNSGTPIIGDISGHHNNVIVTSCAQAACKTTNCADAQKTEPNPCGKDSTYHKGHISTADHFTNQLIGTMTHTVPKNMNGIVLNSARDTNGPHPKGQSMANENSVTTITDISSDFNQHKKVTSYVQENSHTQIIVSNLPADSIIK